MDTDFIGNIGTEGNPLVMSEGAGSYINLQRNEFIENSGGLANIAAFFEADLRFVQTCFYRNNMFLVVLILEFSEWEAMDNYVEDEISSVCTGLDPELGPGRMSVEEPGALCYRGAEECVVECLNNANDLDTCTASIVSEPPSMVPSVSQQPSISTAPSAVASSGPSLSQKPSTSQKPSISLSKQPSTSSRPSISSMPSSLSNSPSLSAQPSESQQPSVSEMPSLSMLPTATFMPTDIPTKMLLPTFDDLFRPPLRPRPQFPRPKHGFFFGQFKGAKASKKYGRFVKKYGKLAKKGKGGKGGKKSKKQGKGSTKSSKKSGKGDSGGESSSDDFHFGMGYLQPRNKITTVTKWYGKRFGQGESTETEG